MKKETLSQQHYRNALETMLSNPTTRILLWRIIVEDCRVFDEDFPMNAAVYCLNAKQEIGKRLLADAKRISPESVFKAEQEYNELMELSSKMVDDGGNDG